MHFSYLSRIIIAAQMTQDCIIRDSIVHQTEFKQDAEDEDDTDAHPHIQCFCVGHCRTSCVDGGGDNDDGDQNSDPNAHSDIGASRIEPEHHPRQ